MLRLACTALALASLTLTSCAGRSEHQAISTLIIPAGTGSWISIDNDLDVESLAGNTVQFPYRVSGLNGQQATALGVTYAVVCTPTPLTPPDRCGMPITGVTVTYHDGKTVTFPATGKLVDNSDGRDGLRLELAHDANNKLVIPARATAVAVFAQRVEIPAP